MKEDYHIKVPQYGAATTHHWDKEKYGMWGVGLAPFRIKDKMILKVGVDYYAITKDEIIEFMNKYPNSKDERQGIMLYVFPIGIMELVKEGKRKLNKKLKIPKKPKKDNTPTLF